VVVDHVEDHLDAGLVQRLHRLLELQHRVLDGKPARGREPRQGAVAPVVRQAALLQEGLVGAGEHRHQLDGGHAQRLQVIDDGRHREPEVLAAPFGRHARVQLRESLDV
jgi:hypothetical protein